MNDNEETILAGRGLSDVPGAPQPPIKPKRNPLLIIGGIGCALLLCAGILIGAGFLVGGGGFESLTAGLGAEEPTATLVPTIAPTATSTPKPTDEPTAEPESDDANDSASTDSGDSSSPAADPEIGSITFALDSTDDYEPIEPGILFEGEVTEIHAIFEYNDLSPDDTWERVWYLDGTEMLRSEELWSGAETGVFDYFINAGGDSLGSGEWVLELYVEGELLASGNFAILEEPVADSSTSDGSELVQPSGDDSEHAADISSTTVASASPTATPVPTSTPRPVNQTYKLAYTKWDGGKHNLFVADTDGKNDQFILGRAAGPSWTADGTYIFFYGEEAVDRQDINGTEYIFDGVSNGVVRIDMSPIPANIDQVRLYQGNSWNDGTARWASVAPNGQMVAYDAKPGGDYRIYFLGTDENQQFRFEILGEQGSWAPDSERIIYRSGRNGQTGIWISNRDDSGHILVTNANDSFPTWSPDGDTFAFARDEGGNVDIYTANIDGTNIQRLTDTPGPDTLPVYTPDGEIVFRSARSGSWSVWKMSGDGSNQQEIIANAGVGPDWAFSKMSVLP